MTQLTRHMAVFSNPIVRNETMFLTVMIKDWNEELCFFYPLNMIDNNKLLFHVMWKMSGDNQYEIKALVDANINASDAEQLNLQNWGFYDDK